MSFSLVGLCTGSQIARLFSSPHAQVRSTKHRGTNRVRFKASVHSGLLNDALNVCMSGFCLYFEEHHYLRDLFERDSPERKEYHTLEARLQRCTACVDKSAGHVVHLDRGYAHVAAQQALAPTQHGARCNGVYSFGCISDNRIGLPRQFIKLISKRLQCPSECTHCEDSPGCSKWRWCS